MSYLDDAKISVKARHSFVNDSFIYSIKNNFIEYLRERERERERKREKERERDIKETI